ncbi:helix-turn-helix domain-containing protein [Avibacterium paragallinarum]|uniref:helix-turn-helix domain-containing protein n=1 Tax=Avibacterium paragallinarum TaxID=728 RepID=UPI001029AE1F|nr:helix-turn-helix domain-containing protein [Avibacterium paragallinarum]RZN55161.1 helix-turn-helix domain-containing protein [Avibacterium paragallinarum]
MSLLLMAKAMEIKVGNPLRKLVLLKLADNANDDGICFPSYQYIADVCEISKASARTHIEALIQMGFISKKARKNKDGSSSNLYILHLDKGMPADSTGMLGDGIGMPADSIGGMLGASTITSHSINQSINLPSSSEKNSDGGESKKSRFKFSDDDMTAAQWIFGLVQKLNPDVKPPSFDSWANEIRLMRERDGRTHREICELFQWANQDSFWKANILSPAKLREKWDQLTVKKNNAKPPRKTVSELNAIEWNTDEGWRGML